MSFEAITERYSGPLDLMLHLISEHKLDIFDLDIDILCTQYLQYLQQFEEYHLEIESEYLVELATLIELKSKRLLPKKENEKEEDPKENLVRRLLEYQRYKEISESLKEAYCLRQESFGKAPQDADDFGEEHEKYNGNSADLLKAMLRLQRRLQLHKPIETKWTRREVSLEDCQLRLKAKLQHLPKKFLLEKLLEDVADRYELVVSILAILDLAKAQIIVFEMDQQEQVWFQKGEGIWK